MITRPLNLMLALAATVLLFTYSACAPTQELEDWNDFVPHSGQSIFSQLNRQDVLEMTLITRLDSLVLNKRTDKEWPALFRYSDENGTEHSYNITVKARGRFRRMLCDFPPIKLNFSKNELEAAGLEPLDKMKLVTHCFDDDARAQEVVLREYLAYKLYNELTPNSFRVQLAKITYQDSRNPRIKSVQWGYLIEDDKELGQRIGGKPCDCMGQPQEQFSASQAKVTAVFQYMVGNSDWDFQMSRNLQIFKMPNEKLVPVPYDFDFASLVGAPYTRPNVDVNQSAKMERVFMGFENKAEELYGTFAYFKTKEQSLLSTVQGFKWLDEGTRAALIDYLGTFFSVIVDQQKVQESMYKKESAR